MTTVKTQIIGLGNVGTELIRLLHKKNRQLQKLGAEITIVSVSDSKGTVEDQNGLNPSKVLESKKTKWKGDSRYHFGCTSVDAIRTINADLIIELTPSTPTGQPGLANIRSAFENGKHVVTANKGPLVVAYRELTQAAKEKHLAFLFEATVAAHVPIFCLIKSCFLADRITRVEGILNATTNYIIGQIEKGKTFRQALDKAIDDGWAETDYTDDVDGIDAARKTVILADFLFSKQAKLADVEVKSIRGIEPLIKQASKARRRVKLICKIDNSEDRLAMSVKPTPVNLNDPFSSINNGDMGVKFHFATSKQVFVSAQFLGPKQTAQAVLNDAVKVALNIEDC